MGWALHMVDQVGQINHGCTYIGTEARCREGGAEVLRGVRARVPNPSSPHTRGWVVIMIVISQPLPLPVHFLRPGVPMAFCTDISLSRAKVAALPCPGMFIMGAQIFPLCVSFQTTIRPLAFPWGLIPGLLWSVIFLIINPHNY